jgi:hypothetical protein
MAGFMGPLELVRLDRLMERSSGRHEVVIGLIDGPVATNHPDLAGSNLRRIGAKPGAGCALTDSVACLHGTFVAGMLSARRGSAAPAICSHHGATLRANFPEHPISPVLRG